MFCINYAIRQGDTLYSISRRYQIPIDAIMEANPMVNVYNLQIGQVICLPASIPQNNYTNFTTYLIEEEDTLNSVLEKNGINLADLLQLNGLDAIRLQPGMTLQVPIIDNGEDVTL